VSLVAVCGIPGAGKSTVCAQLKRLGCDAWDTDVDQLAGWRDRISKVPVPDPADWHDPVATALLEYTVARECVLELRTRAFEHTVYLCGMAGDESAFWDLLDLVICLTVDDATLRYRLATRTTNGYGKASHERDAILSANRTWNWEPYRAHGAVTIDASRPLDDVVSAVIEHANRFERDRTADARRGDP